MADEPQDTMPDEGEGAAAPQAKSKISLKTLILIGLPLVIVQAALAFWVVRSYIQPPLSAIKKEQPVEETTQGDNQDEKDEVDLSEHVPHEVQDIIVNPADTKGQRYLSVSVVIYVPEKIATELANFEPEVRSAIIERISRKRLDELDDPADRKILLTEVKDDLNATIRKFFKKKFPELSIRRVLFSKYTLQ